ncbi:MAG: hypothetical protein IPK10_15320 [Bacteroidetes bacterium]|nr:hypothetical protein [Bacteroidota bacterium]
MAGAILGFNPNFNVFRIPINSQAQVTLCNGPLIFVKDLLRDHYCELSIDANFDVSNLSLPNGMYDVWGILGEFDYDYIDANNNNQLTTVESCDAYSEYFMYLQIEPVITAKLTGPSNPFQLATQCDKIYELHATVSGGMPVGSDDFPNEFRPIIVFPNQITYDHFIQDQT